MADIYTVTAAAAVVKLRGAPEVYRYRGAIVPADAENLEHLISCGLVSAQAGPATVEEEPAASGGGPDLDAMTLEELRAYAKDRNIDLGGATLKAETLDKIKAAQA